MWRRKGKKQEKRKAREGKDGERKG